jgi:hypothetical protein
MLPKHVENTVLPFIRGEIPIKNGFKTRQDNNGVKVVFNTELRCLDYLNPTAAKIYDLCDGKTSVGKILDHFYRIYPDQDAQKITFDVITCLRQMQGRLVLKRCPEQQRGGRPY